MKKVSSFLFSLVMLFSVAIFPVSAADSTTSDHAVLASDSYTHNEIVEKALAAFPEYAENIKGENLSSAILLQPLNTEPNEVVISETRQISEDEAVFYTEYSNGMSLMGILSAAGKKIVNTGYMNNETIYYLNAWVTYAGSADVLIVYDIQCNVGTSSNRIPNRGYIETHLTSASSPMYGNYKQNGTPDSPAYVQYSAYFTVEIGTGGPPIVFEQPAVLEIRGDASVVAY